MTSWTYIRASLRQYCRIHLAVAAGVAVATAVITGALLVGDSVRGSLRGLALESLGRIDTVILAEHPFRAALADEMHADRTLESLDLDAAPVLLTQGAAVVRGQGGEVRRAAGLQVFGVPPKFWSFALEPGVDSPPIAGNEAALIAPVAKELGVEVGDTILLRLPLVGSVPADSTLGEKEETSAARRLRVAAILPEHDHATLARFSLRPSQQTPRNVFVPLATLQDLAEIPGRANAIVVARLNSPPDEALGETLLRAIRATLRPRLEDYGISVTQVTVDAASRTYLRIAADRLVLPPHVVSTADSIYGRSEVQPVVTYLANTIKSGELSIPYSTVAGVDSTARLGPVLDEAGEPIVLADDEAAVNDWTARELGVAVGDSITLSWYEPETTHGQLREHRPLTLKVRAIVPLAVDGRKTWAADPQFAPELPGVTDQASIDDWRLPFELAETIRDEDEKYWEEHRTTPKVFVSHALAERLWKTRWGVESVLRLPLQAGSTPDEFAASFSWTLNPADMGMSVLPAKQQALDAATGTTPFDGLFLGFSFFLMASAVMLVALLYRLGVEQRAREVGLLQAVGMPAKRVRRLLALEACLVAAAGATLGAAGGVGYARLMIYGLNTWWVGATAAPFLELHVTTRSVAIGLSAGLAVALATIVWSLRRFARLPARQLLAGDAQPALSAKGSRRWTRTALPAACLALAVGLGIAAAKLQGETQAIVFMGGGALVLVGVLAAIRGKLREPVSAPPRSLTLAGLAARNARRNPSRTMLSLALASTASFLIVALSAFRLAPTDRGVGGFDLLANSDLPIHYDLNTSEGRRQLGFSDDVNGKLAATEVVAFRVREGEDASCLNLYRPSQPRVLGAPPALAEQSNFTWAGVADPSLAAADAVSSAWPLLEQDLGNDAHGRPIVPAILDANTAKYSFRLAGVGAQLPIRDAFDHEVTLQVVGLLANSVLQGDVIVGEANFVRLFPEAGGRRFFLIRRAGGASGRAEALAAGELSSLLETELEDYGFDAVDARGRLADLMAVQNTYLSTFQSLGALGLLLGVVGLAVVQWRSVLERRGELALMQAAGFRRRRLAGMVLAENLVLLLGGLGIGCLAALAAVLPHAILQQAAAPWGTLALLLAIVAAAGVAAAWFASRSVLRAPLLAALRGD